MPATLADLRRFATAESGLAVVTSLRADGTVSPSVVNVGVVDHPVSGVPVVGFVVRGDAAKLARYRTERQTTVTVRHGWQWVSAAGPLDLAGPDDPLPGLDAGAIPTLLREVFVAAGGSHDDWATYDRVMAEERRTAVLMAPHRLDGVVRR
jgi:hypothetical protein